MFSNARENDEETAKKRFARVRRKQIDQMAAFLTKNNTAYAGAARLQSAIDSPEEDSILDELCTVDEATVVRLTQV